MADGEVVLHRGGEDVGGFNAGLGREGIHEVRIPEALRGSAVHKHVGVDGIADDDVAVEHAEAVEHDGHRVILHLGEGIRIGAAVGLGHQQGVRVVVHALPVVIGGDGRAAQHLRVTDGPVGVVERGGHEGAGLFGGLDLNILDEVEHLLAELLIEQLGGSVVIALVVEPGGRQIGGQVARVGMVAEVEVNRRGDDEHVAHHAVLDRGAGATGADDVGIAEIEAIIHQDGLKGHRAVDLAHAGHAEGDAVLDVQRVRAADDIVALAALAIALIVILSLAGEIAGHFAAFELRQDQRLDGDGLGQREGRADDEQSGNEQSKQFLHG